MGILINNETTTDRNIKFLQRVALIVLILFIIIGFIVGCIFGTNLMPVNPEDDTVYPFTISEGESKVVVIKHLKEQDLIRNELFAKLYLKINSDLQFYAGTYNLKKNMSVPEIYDSIGNTKKALTEDITVQFVEGKRFTDYAKVISDNFENISYDDVINKGKDKEYLQKLIDKYWFITDDILNDKLYYPLEGYLFPDTYNIRKNATIEEIFDVLLTELGNKLAVYKDDIETSGKSIHSLLTLASMVELEAGTGEFALSDGNTASEREVVSSVFNNRLSKDIPLGSDVTTYYDAKRSLQESIDDVLTICHGYNTREQANCVKVPIGPICSPSLSSIAATLNPATTEYYYFVADKNGKLYAAKDYNGHVEIINYLDQHDLW
jgi:UPF0755 protein